VAGPRIQTVAADLVNHFEIRLDAMRGKAMVVCMSRKVCEQLYDEIIDLRPEWHDPAPEKGNQDCDDRLCVGQGGIAPSHLPAEG
jgi:type I restriction enzyme R subunit